MPELSVRGRKLAYAVEPGSFDKSLLTILFVHGSGGDRGDWQGQLKGLSSLVNVVAFELPGHGKSEPPGESTVPAYLQWVLDFVEQVGLQRVMLIGCSLGSAITQAIALSSPTWLVAIGLVGAGARLRVHPAFLDGLRENPGKALAMLSDYCLSPKTGDPLRSELEAKYAAADPELIYGDLSACNEFDVMDRIREVSQPTWIIVGEDDKLTPPKYSDFLNKTIRDSAFVRVPNAGHLVMMEQPSEFNNHLNTFLRTKGLLVSK